MAATSTLENDSINYLKEIGLELDKIEELVMDLFKGGDKQSTLEEMNRIIHSLKGNAGCYGFNYISQACHLFENLILKFDSLSRDEIVDDFLKLKDQIESLSIAYINNDKVVLEEVRSKIGIVDISDGQPDFIVAPREMKVKTEKQFQVLLVENSLFVAGIVKKSLVNYDVNVTICIDGYEALGE
jgi:chemotaxis protein histidine kinase CheA